MLMMRTGGSACAADSFGKAVRVSLLDGIVGSPFLLGKAPFGFGLGFSGGFVVLLRPWAWLRWGFGRSPTRSHANELDGTLPFDDVAERLNKDVCTLGFGTGVGGPEDLSSP